jgi:hypothetical protein
MKTKTLEEFKKEALDITIKISSNFQNKGKVYISWLHALILSEITRNYLEGMKSIADEKIIEKYGK